MAGGAARLLPTIAHRDRRGGGHVGCPLAVKDVGENDLRLYCFNSVLPPQIHRGWLSGGEALTETAFCGGPRGHSLRPRLCSLCWPAVDRERGRDFAAGLERSEPCSTEDSRGRSADAGGDRSRPEIRRSH